MHDHGLLSERNAGGHHSRGQTPRNQSIDLSAEHNGGVRACVSRLNMGRFGSRPSWCSARKYVRYRKWFVVWREKLIIVHRFQHPHSLLVGMYPKGALTRILFTSQAHGYHLVAVASNRGLGKYLIKYRLPQPWMGKTLHARQMWFKAWQSKSLSKINTCRYEHRCRNGRR